MERIEVHREWLDRVRAIPALMTVLRESAERRLDSRGLSPGQLAKHREQRVDRLCDRIAGQMVSAKLDSFRFLMMRALEEATLIGRQFDQSHDRPVAACFETRRMLVFRQKLVGLCPDDEPRILFTGMAKQQWRAKWRAAWAVYCESLELIEDVGGLTGPKEQSRQWELVAGLRRHVNPRLRFYADNSNQQSLEAWVREAYERFMAGKEDGTEEIAQQGVEAAADDGS